jgi:hypothetical protein
MSPLGCRTSEGGGEDEDPAAVGTGEHSPPAVVDIISSSVEPDTAPSGGSSPHSDSHSSSPKMTSQMFQ